MDLSFLCPVCGVPSALRCGGCKGVVYCSKEHQVKHWKSGHKKACRCFEIATNETLGRYMRATRDIRAGEVILREEPLVLGPKVASMPICLGCHRLLPEPQSPQKNFYKCRQCNWPMCGPECEASNYHVTECQLMTKCHFKARIDYAPDKYAAMRKESGYCAILPLRVILLKQSNLKGFERFLKLEDHLAERLDTPLYKILCPNLLTFLKTILGMSDWKDTEIMRIAAALDTNAFEVRQRSPVRKLRAIYLDAAMISHDCLPNTRHVFDDSMNIIFIAKKAIAKGDIISVCYTQPLWCTLQRRQHLENAKCFQCQCKRCSDPTELGTYCGAITCCHCKIGKICSTDPLDNNASWKCHICGHRVSAQKMISGNATLEAELNEKAKGTIDGLERYLKMYEETLHLTNTHSLQAKYALVQLYGTSTRIETLTRRAELCRDLLEVAQTIDDGLSVFRGNLLLGLQEAITLKAKHEFVSGIIKRTDYQAQLKQPFEMLQEAYEIMKPEPNQQRRIKELLDALEMEMRNDIEY